MTEIKVITTNHYRTKQVIVMRTDLNMRKGKMVAQGAHAALAFMTKRLHRSGGDKPFNQELWLSDAEQDWLANSYAKVCVGVGSENDLCVVIEDALNANVEVHEIIDNGTTEFGGVPTLTCCAVGPDTVERVDAITGGLKLL